MSDLNVYKQPTSEMRTTARMVSLLAILTGGVYVLAFVELGTLAEVENVVNLVTAVCIVLASIGLILAFRWEGFGGLISILAGLTLAFIIAQLTENNWLKVFFFSSPFIVSGLFMWVSGWQNRHEKVGKDV